MPIDSPVPFEPAEHHERPEVALCATLYLLSRFTFGGGCTRIAHIIEQHFRLLSENPRTDPLLRRTCAQLLDEWQEFLVQAREQGREAEAGALMQEVLSKAMQNC